MHAHDRRNAWNARNGLSVDAVVHSPGTQRLRVQLCRAWYLKVSATALAVGILSVAHAQEIEPRAYSNAPIGVNFLIAGYAYTEGAVPFDTSLPVKNANLKTSSALLAYARVLDLWGKSAKFDAILPYTWLSGSAEREGEPVERNVSGFADPRFRLSVNLYGAPALTLQEFKDYEQDLIVGASLQVSVPSGQYDESKLVNIGTNRWFFKPEVGVFASLGSLDAGAPGSGNRVHGQRRFLPRQHTLPGPDLLAAGARDLRLSFGYLGFVRRHLLQWWPHHDQRQAERRPAAELAASAARSRFPWMFTTPSSFTRAAGCRREPTTITTSSGLPGSTAGVPVCDPGAAGRIVLGSRRYPCISIATKSAELQRMSHSCVLIV